MNINKKFNDTNIFFEKINAIMRNIQKIFIDVDEKIKKIKKIYNSLMNEHNDKLSLYGLDTLNFQSKLFQLQFENCDNMYKILNNRIYGDYFKLYKIIMNTCSNSSINDQKILSFLQKDHNITVYKDLEPTREYSENDLFVVHELINQIITLLGDYLKSKENVDHKHQDLIKSGFKINSFAYSYNYHKYLLQNQMELYINYLDFYNHNHLKYFHKIEKQASSILSDINEEILFEQNNLLDELRNESSPVNMTVLVQNKVNQNDQEKIQEGNKNIPIINEKTIESDKVIQSLEKKDTTDDNVSIASSITMEDIPPDNEFTVVDNKKKKKKNK
jgi:hypothetical protein